MTRGRTRSLLYVARHAKSSWDDEALDDRSRPLSGRGRRAVDLVAGAFEARHLVPGLVLASPARRVEETVAGLLPVLGGAEVRIDDRIYGAGVGDLLEVLHEVPDAETSVLLVGHNPSVQELVLYLASGTASPLLEQVSAKFPTGATAVLQPDVAWQALDAGHAVLLDVIRPRDLE